MDVDLAGSRYCPLFSNVPRRRNLATPHLTHATTMSTDVDHRCPSGPV